MDKEENFLFHDILFPRHLIVNVLKAADKPKISECSLAKTYEKTF